MQISKVNETKSNPNFGHLFKVSICLKTKNGVTKFVNPSSDATLYRQLNSKIVSWLNEDYYENLRRLYGIVRKTQKTASENMNHRKLIDDLKVIDTDYARFNVVRSVYKPHKLASIATGTDVSIIENLEGAKQIGIAKSSFPWTNNPTHDQYAKELTKLVRGNIINYAESHNVLLRSPLDREVMLRVILRQAGKSKSGAMQYVLDSHEFHENCTGRVLPPVDYDFLRFKHSPGMLQEIRKTVEYHLNKMLKRKVHFNDVTKVLNQKTEHTSSVTANPVKTATQVQKTEQKISKNPKHTQLEFDFDK